MVKLAVGDPLRLTPSDAMGLGYRVVREAGADEYATAVDIAEQLGNPTTIFEATGLKFYDALPAGPMLARPPSTASTSSTRRPLWPATSSPIRRSSARRRRPTSPTPSAGGS